MTRKIALLGQPSSAVVVHLFAMRDRAEAVTPQELAKATREKTRGEAKAMSKAAAATLMAEGQQIVLAHIQPTWLRYYAEELLDGGVRLGPKGLERLRAAGFAQGRKIVDAIKAQRVGGRPANG